MCKEVKHTINPNLFFGAAIILGVAAGLSSIPFFLILAESLSEVFINLLKLISLPIIFLSIVSTISGLENVEQVKQMGQKVVKYTCLTTLVAATVALFLFIAIEPVREVAPTAVTAVQDSPSYLSFFIHIVPSNVVQPFYDNNVIGVLFLAMLLSFAVLSLPSTQRSTLHGFFSSVYAAVIAITKWIVALMPVAIWAFIVLFMRDVQAGLQIKNLALYLTCVVLANCLQAAVVLPAFLRLKGLSPVHLFKGMLPALSVAFFTKSSAAALPMAIRCAEENVGLSRKVSGFTLPLCTTINMNACAAFILTTVLFVSMSEGRVYSYSEMAVWILLSTIAAIGNAGVPMGCYFLSSAFLAAMNVPLTLLGVILPFYTLIDMLESAINVWSDSCVAAMVQKDVGQEELLVTS